MLNYKQTLFVKHYNGNATEAALKAGYKKESAYSQGQRLLKKNEIQQAIKERDNPENKQKYEILSSEQIRFEWSRIAQDKKARPGDRLKALELLARSQGMFIERVEVGGSIQHMSDNQLEQRIVAVLGVLQDNMPRIARHIPVKALEGGDSQG